MPVAWNASSLLAARSSGPGAWPAMLRGVSSRRLASVTSTTPASGTPVITTAMTVSRMIITVTSRARAVHRLADPLVPWLGCRYHQSDVPTD